MSKHTPGKWHIEADEEQESPHPYHEFRYIMADADHGYEIVARTSDSPNQRANAMLLAAVPELLDALTNLEAAAFGIISKCPELAPQIIAARAAIEKATGEEA